MTELRVCSFESRRGEDMRSLIERQGGVPTVVASMREVPLEDNDQALAFGEQLLAGQVDVLVFLTGVGADALLELLESQHGTDTVHTAVEKCKVVVRGPKPVAVLRQRKIRIDLRAEEPNTWHETVDVLEAAGEIAGKVIAVQEYGQPSHELYAALQERGANVIRVPIYRWALPDDCGPLRDAIGETIAGGFDVLLFTSARQVFNVLQVAEQTGRKSEWIDAANNTFIGSIGPACSDALHTAGLHVDHEASPTRMGQLVAQTLAAAQAKNS